MEKPFVTLVLPVLNEQSHLSNCIKSLLNDSYPVDRLTIIIVDGGSTDGTQAVIKDVQAEYPFIRLLHNPKRLQSAAFNIALSESTDSDFIMRCDAHAIYPANFLSTVVDIAIQHSPDIIVYHAHAIATTCFQKAVALAQNSRLGVGNSLYRSGMHSQHVEHGFHGCFRPAAVKAVGGYDETFSHNEDAELSYRLSLAGHKIWLDRKLDVGYIPRWTVRGLLRQYWTYGKGRARNVLKHKVRPRPRQLAPVLFTLGTPILLIMAIFQPVALLPLLLYFGSIACFAVAAACKTQALCLLWLVVVLPIMHFAWGAGFISQWMREKIL